MNNDLIVKHFDLIIFQFEFPESKRKRFKPWENLRRMFQRKNSTASEHRHPAPSPKGQSSSTSRLSGVFGLAGGSSRSRSTSELLTTEPQPIPARYKKKLQEITNDYKIVKQSKRTRTQTKQQEKFFFIVLIKKKNKTKFSLKGVKSSTGSEPDELFNRQKKGDISTATIKWAKREKERERSIFSLENVGRYQAFFIIII